ncbi:MAG: hypothetical protein Q7V62_06420 [Actinomycetota bacterium]|nr:hypothetical protein [Actinomycetota bacterium]
MAEATPKPGRKASAASSGGLFSFMPTILSPAAWTSTAAQPSVQPSSPAPVALHPSFQVLSNPTPDQMLKFSQPPPAYFRSHFQLNTAAVTLALQLDPNLKAFKDRFVPKLMSEKEFFVSYFFQMTKLSDAELTEYPAATDAASSAASPDSTPSSFAFLAPYADPAVDAETSSPNPVSSPVASPVAPASTTAKASSSSVAAPVAAAALAPVARVSPFSLRVGAYIGDQDRMHVNSVTSRAGSSVLDVEGEIERDNGAAKYRGTIESQTGVFEFSTYAIIRPGIICPCDYRGTGVTSATGNIDLSGTWRASGSLGDTSGHSGSFRVSSSVEAASSSPTPSIAVPSSTAASSPPAAVAVVKPSPPAPKSTAVTTTTVPRTNRTPNEEDDEEESGGYVPPQFAAMSTS